MSNIDVPINEADDLIVVDEPTETIVVNDEE